MDDITGIEKIAKDAMRGRITPEVCARELGVSIEGNSRINSGTVREVLDVMMDNNELKLQQAIGDVLDDMGQKYGERPAASQISEPLESEPQEPPREKRKYVRKSKRDKLLRELFSLGQTMKCFAARRAVSLAQAQADNELRRQQPFPDETRALLGSGYVRPEVDSADWEKEAVSLTPMANKELAAMKPASETKQ